MRERAIAWRSLSVRCAFSSETRDIAVLAHAVLERLRDRLSSYHMCHAALKLAWGRWHTTVAIAEIQERNGRETTAKNVQQQRAEVLVPLLDRKRTRLLGRAATWFALTRSTTAHRNMESRHRVVVIGVMVSSWAKRHKIRKVALAWCAWRTQLIYFRWAKHTCVWQQRAVTSRAMCANHKRSLMRLAWCRWIFTVSTVRTSKRLHSEQRHQHIVHMRTFRVRELIRRSQAKAIARVFYRWRLWVRPTPREVNKLQRTKADLTHSYTALSRLHNILIDKQQDLKMHFKWWRLARRLAASTQSAQLRRFWLCSVVHTRRVRKKFWYLARIRRRDRLHFAFRRWIQCLRVRRKRLRTLWCTATASYRRQLHAAWSTLCHHCNFKRWDINWQYLCKTSVTSAVCKATLATTVRARAKTLQRLMFSRWRVVTWRFGRVRQWQERTAQARRYMLTLAQRWRRNKLTRGWERWLFCTRLTRQIRSSLIIMAAHEQRQVRVLFVRRRELFGRWRRVTATQGCREMGQAAAY